MCYASLTNSEIEFPAVDRVNVSFFFNLERKGGGRKNAKEKKKGRKIERRMKETRTRHE